MTINYWRGTTNNDWTVATNWSLGHIPAYSAGTPQNTESVGFDGSSPNPSTLDVPAGTVHCGNLYFYDAPGNVTFNVGGYVNIFGNLQLKPGMTVTSTGAGFLQFLYGGSDSFDGAGVAGVIASLGVNVDCVITTKDQTGTIAGYHNVLLYDNLTVKKIINGGGASPYNGNFYDLGHNLIIADVFYNYSYVVKSGLSTWTFTGTGEVFHNGSATASVWQGDFRITNNTGSDKLFFGYGMVAPGTLYITDGTGKVKLEGNNSFGTVILGAGRNLELYAGDIQSIQNFQTQGEVGNHSTITSTGGLTGINNIGSSYFRLYYTEIANNTLVGAGGQALLADGCVDNGNNYGWLFDQSTPNGLKVF